MVNRVVLVGRITRDPETQQTNTGVPYVRFSLACNRPFKNEQGERVADFINCIAWYYRRCQGKGIAFNQLNIILV